MRPRCIPGRPAAGAFGPRQTSSQAGISVPLQPMDALCANRAGTPRVTRRNRRVRTRRAGRPPLGLLGWGVRTIGVAYVLNRRQRQRGPAARLQIPAELLGLGLVQGRHAAVAVGRLVVVDLSLGPCCARLRHFDPSKVGRMVALHQAGNLPAGQSRLHQRVAEFLSYHIAILMILTAAPAKMLASRGVIRGFANTGTLLASICLTVQPCDLGPSQCVPPPVRAGI